MFAWGKQPATRQEWLTALGRKLVWNFPELQAKEILTDYQEQFEEGTEQGRSDAEIIEALGTPDEAVAQLLEEEPSAKMEQLRYTLLWSAALAVCWAFLWVCFAGQSEVLFWGGSSAFLMLGGSALFMLLRGPVRVTLEHLTMPDKRVSPVGIFLVPAGVMLLCTVMEEILITVCTRYAELLPDASMVSTENTLFLMAVMWCMGLLAVWFLFRCITDSIRYFPGVIHAVSVLGASFFMMVYYGTMNLVDIWIPQIDILFRLLPYFVGLLTALAFQRWTGGRWTMPHCFHAKPVTWTDWRHRLGVSLLGWFNPEQAAEIMEDYQEQFELGRERGKSEEALISELGRPDSVTRALLKEDRKARLRRRRTWLWIALLAAALWCLFRLMLGYTYGTIFVHIRIIPVEAGAFLLLGTAALFMLLHAPGRAALEKRFPAEKRPSVWTFLLPPVCTVLVHGWAMFTVFHYYEMVEFLNRPAGWILAASIEFSVLAMFALTIWSLNRCLSGSIAYLPAVIQAAGSAAGMLSAGDTFSRIDLTAFEQWDASRMWEIVAVLTPYAYLFGLLLAVAVWLVLRRAGKRG